MTYKIYEKNLPVSPLEDTYFDSKQDAEKAIADLEENNTALIGKLEVREISVE